VSINVVGMPVGADAQSPDAPFAQRLKVPPLPDGLTWINTPGPMELSDLRGKFVLLDFWTLGCINCMHIIPELHKLEAAYANELVVVGVHSAKFEAEKKTESITEAVRRYRIEHPVINDADSAVWRRFEVRVWPTVVLIDPEGFAVWAKRGEITFEEVDAVLKKAVPFYRRQKLIDPQPVQLQLASRDRATPLRFPGKVLADEAGSRLFIADSNHNRIVVADLDGALQYVVGSGRIGSADGDFATAEFNQPQGMALVGQTLYVADTTNHLLRLVDLQQRRVSTIAGTGKQNRDVPPFGKTVRPATQALASPWALWAHKDDLYIAMAGPHQIWRMKLDATGIGIYAGNGREDIVDGPLVPKTPYQMGFSSFAQPSGLASDGEWLYVADSEGSSIRAVPLAPRQKVRTLVGTAHLPSSRLFTYGDVDGLPPDVRLQHPLGIVFYEGRLYVADTYNHKIKTIDVVTGATGTLSGTGKPGNGDEPAEFNEPGGLSAANGKLYVADTNNHAVRTIDLRQDGRAATLPITGLTPPVSQAKPAVKTQPTATLR
jgi:thiol-disulfide isomerase/thioredoxin